MIIDTKLVLILALCAALVLAVSCSVSRGPKREAFEVAEEKDAEARKREVVAREARARELMNRLKHRHSSGSRSSTRAEPDPSR